jgi:hypothetical protein
MSGMTFTPAYYVYIRDSPSVLSTDTIPVLSAGLLLHTWAIGGLVYVLSCDIGWAKWALSIKSIVMYINGRQINALTFAGQRKWGALGTVIPSAVL